jgi:CelD/BcsL family acetyltransferase involved in cellulose biosynthesis
MPEVLEVNRIDELAQFRKEWATLLSQTRGASFFQSLDWLECYWQHFGQGQRLRVLLAVEQGRPIGVLPLVVRAEATRVGKVRTLTFPLHDWSSFYGPIGPDPAQTLTLGLKHIRHTARDWDIFELRWQGSPDTDPEHTRLAMLAAGFQAYPTVWDRTAVVDLTGTWQSYWSQRGGKWLRRFRHAERILSDRGEVSYLRYRPLGQAHGDGSPRWDLYDACEQIALRSWQGAATDGTTLSHEAVRGFLREAHQAATAAGALDLNLLLIDGVAAAFVYGYHSSGYVFGLRRGYDAGICREGAGNVLLARVLRDSFARGDRIYDMGPGSLEIKRHFQTRLLPVLRFSHFPLSLARAQLLRVKRWWQGAADRLGGQLPERLNPASIAVGSALDCTADAR